MFPKDQYGEISVVYLFTKGLCKAMCVFVGPGLASDNEAPSIAAEPSTVQDHSDVETDPTVIAACII